MVARNSCFVTFVLLSLATLPPGAFAQGFQQAIPGQPFGVGQFTVPLPADAPPGFAASEAFELREANNRVLYPVFMSGQIQRIVAEFLGDGQVSLPSQLTVMFLFTGTEPLDLTVTTPTPYHVVLRPDPGKSRWYAQSLRRWWQTYNTVVRQQLDNGDYPPLIQTYLTAMLGPRLGLESPWFIQKQQKDRSQLEQTLQLLSGAEELRLAILRETMQGRGLAEPADLTPPEEVFWSPLDLPAAPPEVEVEPIALHVPEECFYMRFGSFGNYLWFDHLKADYGGDISRMVTLRGHNPRLDEKLQKQLALEKSALAEIVGPQVIADAALIGRDLYMREGAACGMLFQARNTALLGANLNQDRRKVLNATRQDGATLEAVTIAGRDVSFLSTPDNRLRSFYAVDGDFHLVTTSRHIVERFLEAGQGQGSLAQSAEFQHARREMPLNREDTIFAYFSSAFFRGLLSPQYQIELVRRLQSVTDMELLQLARLAAMAEGRTHQSIDDLISGGFLPNGFGNRRGTDAPAPLFVDQGFVDPIRGARGTFTPIPDMAIDGITRSEAALWDRSSRFLQTSWPQMDPLMVGVRRFALEGELLERVVIDANVSPLVEEKYGWLMSMVGPPTDVVIQTDPSDVIMLQMTLKGGLLWPDIPPHHLFLGVQDTAAPTEVVPTGFRQTLSMLKSTPGYLGAWPKLGLLDLIPFLSGRRDPAGFSSLPFGVWRWQGGDFSVLSFDQGVLGEAAGHLQPVPTDNPAQIRLHVSDLSRSNLAEHVTWLNYTRAYQASLGNVRLLNTAAQQLRLDKATVRTAIEDLLDTELVCTLNGEYEFVSASETQGFWQSTAWPDVQGHLPIEYTAPLLEWFRGADADLTKLPGRVFFRATIDMQQSEPAPAVDIPLFNLFKGTKSPPMEQREPQDTISTQEKSTQQKAVPPAADRKPE